MQDNNRVELAKIFANDLLYEIQSSIKSGHSLKKILNHLDNLLEIMIIREDYEICIEIVKIKNTLNKKFKDKNE